MSVCNGHIKQECEQCKDDEGRDVIPAPFSATMFTYLEYFIMLLVGYIREFLIIFGIDKCHATVEKNREGYVSLYQDFNGLYTRWSYRRIKDVFNRPVCSFPGPLISLKDRATNDYGWNFYFTGSVSKHINMGSYNYLGFATNKGYWCDVSQESLKQEGISYCSTRRDLGNSDIHEELESLTARFLGVEAAVTFGMGFATNSMNIPALVEKGCLIFSDKFNHASLVLGERLSGADIQVFKHNDVEDLEKRLRKAIVFGQPKTRRPWKKIIIVVEGVYSMEGDIVNLPEFIRLKKKYKAYLYLDEAHSIGALGGRGRGVVDYWGCDPKDVDIMMGTFTKSFNAAGGYIAGTEKLIRYLKATSHAHCYATSMAPSVARQVMTTMRVVMGELLPGEGERRIRALHSNARYFRRRLKQLGFVIYGNLDSPVVPLLLYHVTKISLIVRSLLEHNVVTVGVGFPAVSLLETRARFCLSAAHTKQMLDQVIEILDEIGDKCGLKYVNRKPCKCYIQYEGCS